MEPEKYLNKIKTNDFVLVIFHNDCDGIASALLVEKFLIKKRKDGIDYIISQPMPVEKNLLKKIQTCAPNKIIFLDLAMDQQPNVIKKIKRVADILIIDHHEIVKNLNNKNIIHYNPKFKNKDIYQSAAYITYKIINNITEMKKWLWIAAIGIIGDYELKDSQDLVSIIKKEYNIKRKLYNSQLSIVVDIINAVKISKRIKAEQLFKILSNCKSFEDVIKNEELVRIYNEVQTELESVNLDDVERVGDIIFLCLKSKYDIRSTIATKLGEKYKNNLVIVYQFSGKYINISGRNQSKKWNVDRIFKKITVGIGTGGGHKSAAAAKIKKEKWDYFKNALIEEMQR